MIFWEAFHLSLRLQKTKLPFPTIKDPGKVDVERMQQIRKKELVKGLKNIYKICKKKPILTPNFPSVLIFEI